MPVRSISLTLVLILISSATPAASQDMHEAAVEGDTAALTAMIELGADLNSLNERGFSPLHVAARNRHKNVVELLLNSGAVVDLVHEASGFNAADFAFQSEAFRETAEITELLVSHGARFDPNRVVRGPFTRLDLAVSAGNTDMTRLLLSLGAEASAAEGHPRPRLINAATSGHVDMVKMFLDAGVSVDQADGDGNPALRYAIEKGHAQVVQTLLEHGAAVDVVDGASGRNLLHLSAFGGHVEIATQLVASGVPMDARDHRNKTPLHYAAQYGHRQLTESLVAHGAPRPDDLVENYGRSPHLTRDLAEGEAVAWYLSNRGWALRTSSRLIVFDAEEWGVTRPPDPSLANGFITPDDLRGLDVVGLYTCYHGEIGEPAYLHAIEDSLESVTYVQNAGDRWRGSESSVYLSPLQDTTLDDVRISTIEVTRGMPSLGYLVEVDGLLVYYAGFRAEDLGEYMSALASLKDRVDRVDLAFLPLIEADEDESDFKVFLNALNPKAVFVLDPNRREEEYDRMREKALGWGFEPIVFAAENPGDVFVFPPLSGSW